MTKKPYRPHMPQKSARFPASSPKFPVLRPRFSAGFILILPFRPAGGGGRKGERAGWFRAGDIPGGLELTLKIPVRRLQR